jgi:hypothetical protein
MGKGNGVKIARDAETLRVRVAVEDSRAPKAMLAAIEAVCAALRPDDVLSAKKHPDLTYLTVTFHTPERTWVRERKFFARCARKPELHAAMLEYVKVVNRRARGLGREGLSHGDMHPAGSFAIVPLVLADPKFIPALIEHLRGYDMDHESFHPSLIEELLKRFGLCEETLDLLAWRAIESDGQSRENLNQAVRDHGLLDHWGSMEAFADRMWKINERDKYLPIYVANAGRAVSAGRPKDFERWLAIFEKRGLKFEKTDRQPPNDKLSNFSVAKWPDDYEYDDD